jgi:hypothetical protein
LLVLAPDVFGNFALRLVLVLNMHKLELKLSVW